VDLGTARAIRLVALPTHNFTSSATVEVDAGTSLGASDVLNGSALAAYPSGETAETLEGLNVGYVLILASPTTARYWRIKIVDTGNPAGYIELGRVFLGPAYQPTINAAYGLRQGWEDDSTASHSDGGATILQEKRKRRWATFMLPEVTETEALGNLFPLAHRQGTTRQCYFVFDAADSTQLYRRSFLCRQRELSALEMATLARYGTPLSLVEEL
jgi:hypothetical protein